MQTLHCFKIRQPLVFGESTPVTIFQSASGSQIVKGPKLKLTILSELLCSGANMLKFPLTVVSRNAYHSPPSRHLRGRVQSAPHQAKAILALLCHLERPFFRYARRNRKEKSCIQMSDNFAMTTDSPDRDRVRHIQQTYVPTFEIEACVQYRLRPRAP
jgi:hypothetical protein